MLLDLKHKSLKVYQKARELCAELYELTSLLPEIEKFSMLQQIRRAALSVKLNIAEGCSRKSSKERYRYFEISRGSVNELDAALETAYDRKYYTDEQLIKVSELLNACFALLSAMMK